MIVSTAADESTEHREKKLGGLGEQERVHFSRNWAPNFPLSKYSRLQRSLTVYEKKIINEIF